MDLVALLRRLDSRGAAPGVRAAVPGPIPALDRGSLPLSDALHGGLCRRARRKGPRLRQRRFSPQHVQGASQSFRRPLHRPPLYLMTYFIQKKVSKPSFS